MILFIKHVEVEGPEVLGAFFMKQGFRILVSNLHEGDRLPAHPNGLDAVISLGGPMNVYEEGAYPFLKEEDAFLKECLERGVPVLGICLGSQLLTKAAGGWVVQSPEPEAGWFPVDLTEDGRNDPLFSGFPSRF
ncbi:MAG: type 1 glutamine amidotransferase [Elusimicrobia bacterium]|nr:type 1 glutamine amidotransferase [Elusimicrobiota bacterium]